MNPFFAAIAPEFSGDDPAPFLAMAAARMDARHFGALYPQAEAYLAAHLMALAHRSANSGGGGGVVGAVKSASTGGVSVSYGIDGSIGVGDSSLASTAYGLEYLAILKSIPLARLIRA